MSASLITPAAAPARLPEETRAPLAAPQRYVALDAYRGLIMLLLVSNGFGLRALAQHPFFSPLALQFEHVSWEGAVFWDMIQPAFMFMVGAAMPFALARRLAEGQTAGQAGRHVGVRALRLVLLSQVLMCIAASRLHFQLINVLSQIAFTYFACFLIMQLRFRYQVLAAAAILAGHWGLFALFPGPDGAFSKAGNIGAVIDRAWLGRNYPGSYVTINFISSTVTTLFGVWAGWLVMSKRSHAEKMKLLAAGAAGAFAAGLALSYFNPLVKRLWTASFTLYSAGWVLLVMLVFYWLIDVRGYRKPAFPLVVVGMNSIFIYSVNEVLRGWLNKAVGVFTGNFQFIGTPAPVAQSCAVLLVMWGLCYWLYRRRIFFKV